jgi:hypothetical protein
MVCVVRHFLHFLTGILETIFIAHSNAFCRASVACRGLIDYASTGTQMAGVLC